MGRLFSIIFLLLGASSTAVLAQAEVDWQPLSLEGEKRAIAFFPLPFAERRDTVITSLGEIPLRTYYARDLKGLSGNRFYSVMVYQYPEGSFPADSVARIEAFFDATVEASAAAVGGEVRFASNTDRAYPGRVFRIDFGEQGNVSRNRVYLVGDRYYHQQIISAHLDDGSKSRERFFESFRPNTLPRTE